MSFSYITNNVANSSITTNVSYRGQNGRYGQIVLTAASGYIFSGVGNFTVTVATAYLNNSSSYTYNAVLSNDYKSISEDGKTLTINFYNRIFEPAYDYTQIIITGTLTPESTVNFTNNINNTTLSHSIENDNITINIEGNISNYRFTTIPTITYTDLNGVTQTVQTSVTVVNGVSRATVTISNANLTNNNFVVNGVYEQFINIINNIDNTTETHTFTSNDINLYIATNQTYYKFTSLYVTYTDTSDNLVTLNLTLNQAQNVGMVTLTNVNYDYNVNIYGNIILNVNIINNVDTNNTTVTSELVDNDLYITIEGLLNNYEFYNVTLNYNNTEINGNIENDSVTFVVENANLNLTYTIEGQYLYTIYLDYVISNCTVTPLNLKVTENSIITLTATPNQYFIFETQPYLRLQTLTGHRDFYFDNNTLTFDFSTVEEFENLNHIIVNAVAQIDNTLIDKYGSIYAYITTIQNLTDFAKIRFETVTSGGVSREIDKGIYIKSLKRIYLNNIFAVDNNLRLGNYLTNIIAKSIINDTIELNAGNVLIPSYSNNITDFQNEYTLFLPFYGFYKIENDFIGKTLNVKYICNLINGLAIITISANNYIIDKIQCNIATDILYKTTDKTEIQTNGNITNDISNLKGLQPYLNIKYYTDLNENIYNNDCKHNQIKNFTGFIKCSEIFFDNDKLKDVEELIKKELTNGVIV